MADVPEAKRPRCDAPAACATGAGARGDAPGASSVGAGAGAAPSKMLHTIEDVLAALPTTPGLIGMAWDLEPPPLDSPLPQPAPIHVPDPDNPPSPAYPGSMGPPSARCRPGFSAEPPTLDLSSSIVFESPALMPIGAGAGAPIVADELYGGTPLPAQLQRHALHALALSCRHPDTGRTLELVAPLADDMRAAMAELRLVPPTAAQDERRPAACAGVDAPEHLERVLHGQGRPRGGDRAARGLLVPTQRPKPRRNRRVIAWYCMTA